MSYLLYGLPYYSGVCDSCLYLTLLYNYPTLKLVRCESTGVACGLDSEIDSDIKPIINKLMKKVNGNSIYCGHYSYRYNTQFVKLYMLWDIGVLI